MKQKLAELINVIFGMRKFILMMILYIVGIVFRLMNLVSGAEMVDLFKATTIAFMGANGVEHLVMAVKSYNSKGTVGNTPGDDSLVAADEPTSEAENGK